MRTLYNIGIHLAACCLWVSQLFGEKMRLFVQGRKKTFRHLSQHIAANDQSIWFHCASLGEFEQGVPIMEAVKQSFPNYKIVVSFFSPSGYEIKKNTPIADVVVYLPMDTALNARKFVDAVHPKMALFVKYEFWPNYLFQLKKQAIPTLLVSGLFRKKQVFFKPHGGFMRKALTSFEHIFVQNDVSKHLLTNIGLTNVSVSGDTRFDRVSHQIEVDNMLPFMEVFKNNSICIVCGSTWPADDAVLFDFINAASKDITFVVAPHKMDKKNIKAFEGALKKQSLRYSQISNNEQTLSQTKVLIIDTIGLLTKIYSYADIAYVGGAMGNTGLHNILEAATFGVPVVIGQHYEDFPEAKRLQSLAGLFSITTSTECTKIFTKLVSDSSFRNKTGMIAGHFVNSNTGATAITMARIKKLLSTP